MKLNESSLKQPQPANHSWLWLIVITLAGLGFRLWQADTRSLWGDEIFTLAHAFGTIVSEPTLAFLNQAPNLPATPTTADYTTLLFDTTDSSVASTIKVLTTNNHPPLFFGLMNLYCHWVISTWGYLSTLALRLPAILMGSGCIPMIFLVGKQLHNRTTGLIAAGLMALSGYQIYHSQDARPYTMVTLLSLILIWLLIREIKSNTTEVRWLNWNMMGLVMLIGLYTHYFFIPMIIVTLLLGILLILKKESGKLNYLKGLELATGIAAIGYLPWIPTLLKQLDFIKALPHYTDALWNPLQLPEILFRYSIEFIVPGFGLAKIIFLALIIGIVINVFYVVKHKPKWTPLLMVGLLWLISVYGFQLGFDLLKQTSTTTVRRYLLLAAPAIYLLTAYGIYHLKSKTNLVRNLWLIGITGLLSWNSWQIVNGKVFANPNYRNVMEKSAMAPNQKEAVLITNRLENAIALSWYSKQPQRLYHLSPTQVANEKDQNQLKLQLAQATADKRPLEVVWVKAAPSLQVHTQKLLEALGYQLTSEEKQPKILVQYYTLTHN